MNPATTPSTSIKDEGNDLGTIVRANMPWSAWLRLPGASPFELLALGFLIALVLTAIFVDVIPGLASPRFPYGDFSQPPEWSLNGLLGTDDIGRSILSRVLYGARTSLMIVGVATCISVSAGLLLGMLAGYYRGIFERIVDLYATTMSALPSILVVLAFVTATGPSVVTIMLILGILDIGTYARVAKAGVISQSNRDYVLAARAMGARDGRILLKEILPNLIPALTAVMPTLMAGLIITEGSLSFLGYGIPAPAPSWGGMIASSTDLLSRFPLLIFGPVMAIVLTVYALNTVGDYFAQRLNSREREN
ncbi:ABC transporter permease [Agrobacterium rubi]|uniref:ABC transporter permease n=1 Tax=Agrobacterium rubi TaxID=28099 RepID=UPI001573D72E|nr:ABC transporter permease [Agrobacterium rubi]NTF10408.1 ABC transporter permease [Agrobacterium rubi]NTF22802.1 ABC transporter permease [Agrobacterium rubi]NTF29664.1 ABC transporter permease [Agrobacterium rubi]